MRRASLLTVCAAVLIVSALPATAQRWVGGGGTWDEKKNWFPEVVPTGASTVEIDGSPQVGPGVRAASSFASLGSLDASAGMVTVTGPGALWGNGGEIRAGGRLKSSGSVEVLGGGEVAADFLELGWIETSAGTLSVSGTGSLFTANGINVGRAGAGRMKIEDGGRLSLGALTVGALSGSTGDALITGGSSLMEVARFVRVGYGGSGQLTLDSRTRAKSGDLVIGGGTPDTSDGQPGIGRVLLKSASSWASTGQLAVGSITTSFDPFSEGYLTIEGGSVLSVAAQARIGLGSKGEVIVRGARSRLTIEGGGLDSHIGLLGSGKLTVLDGAVASFGSPNLFLGWSPTGPATVLVDGPGSTLTSAGPIRVTVDGSATVTVDNGGKITAPSVWIGTRLIGGGVYEPGRVQLRGGADPARRGVLETGLVTSLGVLEFDGGVLRATAHQPSLIQPGASAPLSIAARGAFIDSNGYDIGIQRPFTGPGGLTKQGAGTLVLSGDHTYGGMTRIEAGTLALAGSVTGDAIVGEGGVLKGTGSIGGRLTVEAGGMFAPGLSPGAMTLGGFALLPGSVLELELGSTHDRVLVLGDATLDGTLELSFLAGWIPVTGSVSTLMDVRGHRAGSFTSIVTAGLPAGQRYDLSFDAGQLQLTTLAPVPEPETAVLMLAALAVIVPLAARRRRGCSAK